MSLVEEVGPGLDGLSQLRALMIVQETVTSWHRKQFRRYWWKFIPM